MPLTSTVPAAVAALKVKMQAVAAAHSELSPGVYVGEIVGGSVANNFLAAGSPTGEGQLVVEYAQDFQGMYATQPIRRTESYGINGMIRAHDETVDPIARLTDAFTLLNALMTELAADKDAGGALGTSGVWSVGAVENPVAGKLDRRGWGVVLTFTVAVAHVVLTDQ